MRPVQQESTIPGVLGPDTAMEHPVLEEQGVFLVHERSRKHEVVATWVEIEVKKVKY